jgi:hypothetical protein
MKLGDNVTWNRDCLIRRNVSKSGVIVRIIEEDFFIVKCDCRGCSYYALKEEEMSVKALSLY